MEELIPGAKLSLLAQYEEALIQGGYLPGHAPPDVERLLDDQIAEWRVAYQQAASAAAAAQQGGATEPPEAGLEEIVLSPEVSANRLVILTPATAEVLNHLGLLSRGGAPLQVAVIVQDDAQEARVRAGLEEAGGALVLWGMTNLSRTDETLGEAIVSFQVQAWTRAAEAFVIETFQQLHGLGNFLKIQDISFRSWLEWVQRRLEQAA